MILLGFVFYLNLMLVFSILIIISISICSIFIHRLRQKHKIEKVFSDLSKNESYNYAKYKDMPYDYKLELKHNIYYIKLLHIDTGKDLLIFDENTWVIKNIDNKRKKLKLNQIKPLIDLSVENEGLKTAQKIFIIYPSSGNVIRYINQYESEFVYHNTDIFGCRVCLCKDLFEDSDILD
ncbi:MAG: hypothetical protein ACI35W_04175 [Anaeroplasmataceae bacterium]